MKIYKIAKQDGEYLTPEEREEIKKRFKDIQCSFKKDKDGYYCHTHRARSKSYPSIADIPQSKVDFINSTSAIQNVMVKTAVADGEFRDLKDRVNSIKDDIRGLKKDDKDIESRVKKLEKTIDDLNIGNRMFSDVKNVFTSLQRKMERADAVVQEWKNYKKEMDDSIRKQVEKHTKARISDVTPRAY
jgi:uncharacterized protein YhaN